MKFERERFGHEKKQTPPKKVERFFEKPSLEGVHANNAPGYRPNVTDRIKSPHKLGKSPRAQEKHNENKRQTGFNLLEDAWAKIDPERIDRDIQRQKTVGRLTRSEKKLLGQIQPWRREELGLKKKKGKGFKNNDERVL